MSDIDKLVENYFAPRSKSLTKQMLYEMFDEAFGEQEQEEQEIDPFALDPSLTNEEIGSILLGKIKETSNLPQDAVYKGGRFTVVLDNFGPLKDRNEVIKDLIRNNIISQAKPYRAGQSRAGKTNYYFLLRNGNKKFVSLILTQGRGTVASKGFEFEEAVAHSINSFLVDKGLEDDYIAAAEGKFGTGSDVVVKHQATDEKAFSLEAKRSKGSRVDFGQFRIRYDRGWHQATGLKNDIIVDIFNSIKDELNKTIQPLEGSDFPEGPSLTPQEAEQFWDAYKPNRNKSLSADVLKVEIDKNLIQNYYRKKGDDYIVLGNDIYALRSGTGLIELKDALENVVALVRIKYHGPEYSYTVALRGAFIDESSSEFTNALEIIFS
jgi:hypothetical protein